MIDYEKGWIRHFLLLKGRKPTKQERIIFRVGFDAGKHSLKET